jgi:hypothetical protein
MSTRSCIPALVLLLSACAAEDDDDSEDACDDPNGTIVGQLFEDDGDTPLGAAATIEIFVADDPEPGPDDGSDPAPSSPITTTTADASGAFSVEVEGGRDYWVEAVPWTGSVDGEDVRCEFEEDRAEVTTCEEVESELEVSDCEPTR